MTLAKYLITIITITATLGSLTVLPARAADSNIIQRMLGAIDKIDLPSGGEDPDTRAQEVVGGVINAFLSIFGILFMALIIYGGYRWMMARGNEEEVKKSRDIIRGAVIGLIIVMASYAISFFVTQMLLRAT